jgi:DtxR family transcriptional regulator, Mn-dependent transcriptional regulator
VTNSLEDYLETIYMLTQANGHARVRDVASALHVKMPSVIKAVLELKRYGYVTQEPYGKLDLTVEGVKAASLILGRHTLLKEFLVLLGVTEETAEKDACGMEHFLGAETLARITDFVRRKRKRKSARA